MSSTIDQSRRFARVVLIKMSIQGITGWHIAGRTFCWLVSDCNTAEKKTVFPLKNPTQRAKSHNDAIARERELFVNPAEEDPREHIHFEDDVPVADTPRGWHMIEEIGLRRANLAEARLVWFKIINRHIDMVKLPRRPNIAYIQDEAREFIEKSMQPDAEFSAMVIDLVALRGL